MDLETLKAKVKAEVDIRGSELIEMSLKIHANPEVAWREEKASRWLSDYLKRGGFRVEMGICGLATAFRASYGEGKPAIAFLAEYDALPEIGHGCGHNIIATTAVGAAFAVKSLVNQLRTKILVLGCPAEEALGGKTVLLEKKAFDGIDVALMIHPVAGEKDWAGFKSNACASIQVTFLGKSAHAATDPCNGANALEALILAFNNINALRSRIRDRSRISGIISEGGKSANMVPKNATGLFMIRAPDNTYLDEITEKVFQCFEAAALATETKTRYSVQTRCGIMRCNPTLAQLFKKNMTSLNREVGEIFESSASTDMGNVSVIVPSLHAFLSICSESVPFHSPEFATAAVSHSGKHAVIDGAKALAMTAIDVIMQPKVLSKIKKKFAEANQ